MTAVRTFVQDSMGLARNSRAGDNPLTSRSLTAISADANRTITAADMAGGLIQFTGFTAGRTITTDTAANIIAANPWMDINDSFECSLSVSTAFVGTFAAGTGVTLAGKGTVPASGHVNLLTTRTGAATVTITVL